MNIFYTLTDDFLNDRFKNRDGTWNPAMAPLIICLPPCPSLFLTNTLSSPYFLTALKGHFADIWGGVVLKC